MLQSITSISFVDVIDYIGTFAFAISGVRLASAKRFDMFGAYIVGLATAVGGGTIRDLLLGVTPFWMTRWIYLAITFVALLMYMRWHRKIDDISKTIFLFDAIGLALFTVVGYQKALDAGFPFWTANIMGMLTGAAGGVLRDIFINEVPLIFRSDIYAMACCAGGVVFHACLRCGVSAEVSQILCALTVFATRLLAVRYHWQLPVLGTIRETYHLGRNKKHASKGNKVS